MQYSIFLNFSLPIPIDTIIILVLPDWLGLIETVDLTLSQKNKN